MSMPVILPGQLRLILSISIVYLLAWFGYYSQIPAGLIATEEVQAITETAFAIADGSASVTAPVSLYTYSLSWLAGSLDDAHSLTLVVRGINGLCLLLAVGFAASAAGHYWRRNRAVWVCGLLIGINPVLVLWAGDLSPTLPATAALTIAVHRFMRWIRRPTLQDTFWIGLLLALTGALQAALLPLAALWPLVAARYPKRERIPQCIAAVACPALLFGLAFIANLQLLPSSGWAFDSFGAGIYAAFNNHEAFDGKSFSLYRQLHSLLFVNPLHWGLLFLLAGGGCYVRLKDGHRGHSILFFVAILAVFAISYSLSESGSQARATLIPLLGIYAAGITGLPKIWKHAGTRTRRKILFGTLALAALTYSRFGGVTEPRIWENDYTYLAQANLTLGHNERATTWAEKALELNPGLNEMEAVLTRAQFNEWAVSNQSRSLTVELSREYLAAVDALDKRTVPLEVIRAIYLFKLKETDTAVAIWRSYADRSALANVCLIWTGRHEPNQTLQPEDFQGKPYATLLEDTLKVDRNKRTYLETQHLLNNIFAFAY